MKVLTQKKLLALAKKKGFKKGVRARCNFVGNPYQGILSTNPKVMKFENDISLWAYIEKSGLDLCIYDGDTGKWAKIIKPSKKKVGTKKVSATAY